MKKVISKNLLFVFIISVLISGCVAAELAEALAVEDVAAVAARESVYYRSASVVRLSATEGAVVDDIASLNSSLRRIRLSPSTNYSTSPRLLYTFNGETKAIAEVTSENSIRLLQSGKTISFPKGQLYTVRNKLVNLRTGPGINNYKVFTHVEKNEIVLVLEKNNEWSKIQIGKDQFGYIKTELLAPLIIAASHNSNHAGSNIQTQTYVLITDTTYNKVACDKCYGKGCYTCYSCSGKGVDNSTSRWERYLICEKCKGTRQLKCNKCNGEGLIKVARQNFEFN